MEELDKKRRRLLQREADVERLNALHQQAVHSGTKLGPRDRLKAAFHLTRAWKQAKIEGLRKEDFQEAVCARLQRTHSNRREFRLSNWTLRRGEDPSTQDLMKKYEKKSTPQKALEPYLVGISVAAEHCGVDPDDWKIEMTRSLSLWSRAQKELDVTPLDDRPAETLAILLNSLCAELGTRNDLAETFEVLDRMSCRWETFEERLVACEKLHMEQLKFMSPPIDEYGTEIDMMFPFPSVPLLRVPYAVGTVEFELAAEAMLQPIDKADESRRFANGLRLPPDIFPENLPGLERAEGDLFFYREIRLAIVPDGRGGFEGNLESRPHVEVEFDKNHPFSGRHTVMNGHMIDLDYFFFLATEFDEKYRFPTICANDGTVWRVNFAAYPPGSTPQYQLATRYPETTDWRFDIDPVRSPGQAVFSTEYIPYTTVAAADLRHWFTQDWKLEAPWDADYGPANVFAHCPWSAEDPAKRKPPPLHELNFPDNSYATVIETSLHDGSIETALQVKIDSLKSQTARLQAEWNAARERHSNALLRRWKSASEAINSIPKGQ